MTSTEHHAEQAEQWAVVREIETVTGIYGTEPGPPFYRIEINGYCADFDYRAAAENFADAIQRAFAAREAELVGALEAAKSLIGAGNGDHPNEAIRQSNINQAWHILSAALKSREASHG